MQSDTPIVPKIYIFKKSSVKNARVALENYLVYATGMQCLNTMIPKDSYYQGASINYLNHTVILNN